jgi:cell division protease FtsH
VDPSKKRTGTSLVWIALIAICIFIVMKVNERDPRFENFDQFKKDLFGGQVSEISRENDGRLVVSLHGSREKYFTYGSLTGTLQEQIAEQNIPVRSGEATWWYWLIGLALCIPFLWMLLRRKNKGTGFMDIFSLRKSPVRLLGEQNKVTFADVGGCEEAKILLGDLIDFLKNPQRWTAAGARIPRGVLLEGPPGCGKTLLARAVAGETSARFYFISASEFVEMFVGVGAARVRDTFDTARKNAPAVIFIDELDAVGRRRGSGVGSAHDEREQTLNQLLICLDGFESADTVVVISATNRPDILDPALVRAGRFDRRIPVPMLSRDARLQTLKIHARNKNPAPDVSLEELADRTEGFNGAQLENLTNEAAIRAVRLGGREENSPAPPPPISRGDFLEVLNMKKTADGQFNKIDGLLIESATQLARPTGKAAVRVILRDNTALQGKVLWANAHYLKLQDDGSERVVAKSQILHLEALDGTELAQSAEIADDPWGGRAAELA